MPSEVEAREPTVEELKRELVEARDQQTATSEILRVISISPSNAQPVFAEIAKSSARLCDAYDAIILLKDGDLLRHAAHEGPIPIAGQLALQRGSFMGRAVLEQRTIHVADLQAEVDEYPVGSEIARRLGHRTMLAVPLMRAGKAIGVIALRRLEKRPFSERQIELLRTFADQAVIAIENTRLFEEVQVRTRELTEALEQQTATADVLKVISRSALDLQRVLDALVESAARLCNANDAAIFQVFGDGLRLVAHHGQIPLGGPVGQYTVPLVRGRIYARAVLDRKTTQVADLLAEADEYPESWKVALQVGWRTALCVPLLHAGVAIGVIFIRRTEVRPFTERQIELVNTFADQAVIAIKNTRLFEAEQASKRELTEALEQQTATAEVLKVISRSAFNLQTVLAELIHSAVPLCEADFGHIRQRVGELYPVAASFGLTQEQHTLFASSAGGTVSATRGSIPGRALIERRIVHFPDVLNDPEFTFRDLAKSVGFRAAVGAPLISNGQIVGVMTLNRATPGAFSEKQLALLETFADQAVIAIENTRLFEEVQARTNELQRTLEYQTATGEVLEVIGRSPTDLQPVFDTIAQSAARLCNAQFCHLFQFDGQLVHFAAVHGLSPEGREALQSIFPMPPGRATAAARAILSGVIEEISDVTVDPDYAYADIANIITFRSIVAVPMIKNGRPIGAIAMARSETGQFPKQQIELLRTFADQAVIAVENTRLFDEVQARNRDLKVALEQQTATSELLKVIGQSTFDLQPVFETLAENAVRLCEAERAFIFQFDGQLLQAVASHNASSELRAFIEQHPQAPGRGSATARAALERRTLHIHDVQADPEYTYASRQVDPIGTIIAIPMLRARELLGVITIYRHEVLPFTDGQIALLETFADQAAIAIENTRLFEEVQARNRDLTALGEVGRAVSSTLNLKMVLKTIVDRAVDLSGTDAGSIFYFRQEFGRFVLGETSGLDGEAVSNYRKLNIAEGQTGLGEAIANRQPLQVPDVTKRASNSLRDAALEAGLYAALIVPLLSAEGPLGALVLQRRQAGEFPHAVVNLMQAFADQSTIALENARLFDEIAQKGRELEIASQHKSQFVANMSHELRTPLAAILGYAELMQEGFYEPLGQKSLDALTRIRSNGRHLLGLINTVLDIAKIESGQFTLNMSEYAIETVVETVRAATESLAQNKKLTLTTSVDKSLPVGLGDEQRLTQVLLNLVGNAIKFTDTGEVRVTAKAVNGHFNVSVTDTGPGIPEEHQIRIFEQFHQVDSSNTKAKGGTGLGLAIAKEIVEMHGGRIWVVSTPGKGSTFQMELPTRAEFRKRVS